MDISDLTKKFIFNKHEVSTDKNKILGMLLDCLCSFLEVVGLEQGPLSLVSTIEVLLGRKCSCILETREYGCGDPLC
jgi:hypothetical protein